MSPENVELVKDAFSRWNAGPLEAAQSFVLGAGPSPWETRSVGGIAAGGALQAIAGRA
jgi:hypothetical protein